MLLVRSIGAVFLLFVACSADATPPNVLSTDPVPDATDVSVDTSIFITFDEGIDQTTLTEASFILKDNLGTPVTGTVIATAMGGSFTPEFALLELVSHKKHAPPEVYRDALRGLLRANYKGRYPKRAYVDAWTRRAAHRARELPEIHVAIARIAVEAGAIDKAIRSIEKARIGILSADLKRLRKDPSLKPLWELPRFQNACKPLHGNRRK